MKISALLIPLFCSLYAAQDIGFSAVGKIYHYENNGEKLLPGILNLSKYIRSKNKYLEKMHITKTSLQLYIKDKSEGLHNKIQNQGQQ